MKFTLSWLKDHLDTTASLDEICNRLVSLGLEVESVDNPAERLKPFVVADVISCEKHPNADRLSVCLVEYGTGTPAQVVCGAPNVRKGLKVVFAPLDSVIPSTGLALKKGKIRDVESCGMLCSGRELELTEDSDGIMELEIQAKAGTSFVEALELNDPVIEIGITPNRADCFGIRGVARDLAASGLGTLKPLKYAPAKGTFDSPINVNIDDLKACPAFSGVLIRGVKNGQSPDWVQRRLNSVGLRPISALVDVTNYLNYDLCRPLHVFDADTLKGNICVRLSKNGETLEALNDKTYSLTDQMTVVTDDSGVLALGGVMGGLASSCTDKTTNVFVECALFDPIRTASTGRGLNLLSDSRTRFERGIDPESLKYGLDAAIHLIQEWCGGEVSHVVSTGILPSAHANITLTKTKLKGLSGYLDDLVDAANTLEKLGFAITSKSAESIEVTPPSFRCDIEGAADLVEEILRLKGYDAIPSTPLPEMPVIVRTASLRQIARRTLAARGFQETVTYSFMEEDKARLFGWSDQSLQLANPISQELVVMRPSILPNLIDAAVRNHSRGNDSVCLTEVAQQYTPQGQEYVATGIRCDQAHPRHWLAGSRSVDIYDVKADVVAVLAALGVNESSLQIEASAPDYYHPGRSGSFKQGQKVLATFGQIHPKIAQTLDYDHALVGFEIYLDRIPVSRGKKAALTLSPYQPVMRDFAFVVDADVQADKIVKAVAKIDRTLITDVDVFDVYTGDKLEVGKKSLAIQVRLDPVKGTMNDAEITDLSTKIITTVEKQTGGVLRQS